MAEKTAYSQAFKTGKYDKVTGLIGKYDNVRRFWEDQVTGIFLRPFLNNLMERKRQRLERIRILDLGCGFGAIGLSIKTLFPSSNITMIDINTRAVEYAQRNAAKNNLTAQILASDLFQEIPETHFHDIVSNPPIAMGKSFLIQMVDECFNHITSGGSLWLVAFHNKRSPL